MTAVTPARRVFLVLGPESSGTRLVTSVLVSAGCYGTAEHVQPFDNGIPPDLSPVVWRRSYPHGHDHKWPNLSRLVEDCGDRSVTVLITVRDMLCMVRSQLSRGHVQTERQAIDNIRLAYEMLWIAVIGRDWYAVSYESLVLNPAQAQTDLLNGFLLPLPEKFVEVYDGNKKHYDVNVREAQHVELEGQYV